MNTGALTASVMGSSFTAIEEGGGSEGEGLPPAVPEPLSPLQADRARTSDRDPYTCSTHCNSSSALPIGTAFSSRGTVAMSRFSIHFLSSRGRALHLPFLSTARPQSSCGPIMP